MKLNLYEIRLCRTDEIDKLREFLNKYWKENHILVTSKKIFEFQYSNGRSGHYDFVVAVHKETQEFHAILGFINSSTYDGGDKNNPEAYYGAVWKVREDVENKEVHKLGLGVFFFLLKMFPNSPYITLGLSKDSQCIYEAMHLDFGKMKHYYLANPHINDFKIAYKPHLSFGDINSNISIRELNEVPEMKNCFFPNKNRNYIVNRYINHPVYKYKMWGIYIKNQLQSLWIIRLVEANGSKCLRIMDMIGTLDNMGDMKYPLIEEMKKYNSEYVDCYNHGIDPNLFYRLGFYEVTGDTIIPNYFEPFKKDNIDIYYAAYSKKPVVVFKADGDQDRPSKI